MIEINKSRAWVFFYVISWLNPPLTFSFAIKLLRQPVALSQLVGAQRWEIVIIAFCSICLKLPTYPWSQTFEHQRQNVSDSPWQELGHSIVQYKYQFQFPGNSVFSWFLHSGKPWVDMLTSVLARLEQRYYFECHKRSGFLDFRSLNKLNISLWEVLCPFLSFLSNNI